MTRKRPNEPIAPTTLPGEAIDPKIPRDQQAEDETDEDAESSETEQPLRDSEQALDRAMTRIPPD